MNPDDFEQRMRALEYFHDLRVLPGTWPVLRLDGRSFSRLTEAQVREAVRPAISRAHVPDDRGAGHGAGRHVRVHGERRDLRCCSPSTSDVFDRSVEKLVSIAASIARRDVLARARGGGPVRLPHLDRRAAGARRRLLSLASGRRCTVRLERLGVLDAAQGGPDRRAGNHGAPQPDRRLQERAAVPERRQLQRRAGLAEAWQQESTGRRSRRRASTRSWGRPSRLFGDESRWTASSRWPRSTTASSRSSSTSTSPQ